ncbi:hypothetical protein GF362_04495 [Candidatus Dojkabacteria bacterium]|nr:hypothetical protein [Candidatus Dojkabacteria bacterium]
MTNIYSSIKDIEKYRILNQERRKLDSLKEENYDLIQKRDFYNSKYYQRLYSREALNMAEPDQEIFYIERRNIYDYDKMTDIGEKIDLQNFKMWWIRLIL